MKKPSLAMSAANSKSICRQPRARPSVLRSPLARSTTPSPAPEPKTEAGAAISCCGCGVGIGPTHWRFSARMHAFNLCTRQGEIGLGILASWLIDACNDSANGFACWTTFCVPQAMGCTRWRGTARNCARVCVGANLVDRAPQSSPWFLTMNHSSPSKATPATCATPDRLPILCTQATPFMATPETHCTASIRRTGKTSLGTGITSTQCQDKPNVRDWKWGAATVSSRP